MYLTTEGEAVGFSTLEVCRDYDDFTDGVPHPYIPLLAKHPTVKSFGYGTAIVQHLIKESIVLASDQARCHDSLFLDVYTTNDRAIHLYNKLDFKQMTPQQFQDPDEDGKPYIVLARHLSVAPP